MEVGGEGQVDEVDQEGGGAHRVWRGIIRTYHHTVQAYVRL